MERKRREDSLARRHDVPLVAITKHSSRGNVPLFSLPPTLSAIGLSVCHGVIKNQASSYLTRNSHVEARNSAYWYRYYRASTDLPRNSDVEARHSACWYITPRLLDRKIDSFVISIFHVINRSLFSTGTEGPLPRKSGRSWNLVRTLVMVPHKMAKAYFSQRRALIYEGNFTRR